MIPKRRSGKMGEVFDLHVDILFLSTDPELKFAARTESEHLLGPHLQRLIESCLAYFRRNGRVFNERQNAAAAMRLLAVVRHLHKVDIGNGADHISWGLVHS